MKKNKWDIPKSIAKLNAADQAWWTKDIILISLVILLSSLDAITLYTVFEAVMYESQIVCLVLTIGCAISLNFIPLVLARFIHYYRYRMNGIKLWMLIALCAVFLLLFFSSFYLRWETRALSFSGMESSMVDITGQSGSVSSVNANGSEAIAVTILLGILPGVTSAINLALGYINDDPVRRKIDKLKQYHYELQTQRDNMMAACLELDQDWEARLNVLDQEGASGANQHILATGEQIKALARLALAMKLGDAPSVNYITEAKLEDEGGTYHETETNRSDFDSSGDSGRTSELRLFG